MQCISLESLQHHAVLAPRGVQQLIRHRASCQEVCWLEGEEIQALVSCEETKKVPVVAATPGRGAMERGPIEGKAWGGFMKEVAFKLVVKAFSDGLWEVRSVQAPG